MLTCVNPTCQAENPDSSYYCGRCGTHIPTHNAGLLLEATQFCRTCGTRRERYPNDRRMCTVLFADVHGFTSMSETLNDVEKVTEIMNDVFTRLTGRIVEMGGSIDKYSGDNIMARFGAPEAHEDDPERAVRAALNMQIELRKISNELQALYGFSLDMRIGLNTGEVNAAQVGGEVHGISYKTYTVMGDTVNLASRLEHEARIGHILVGELTHRMSAHAFEYIDIGFKQIRGKREPVHCFEVIGPKQERRNRRGLSGRDLPLIGRDKELNILWQRLEEAVDGRGQVVSVVGEAGVGKSSLLRELKRRVKAFDHDIWHLDGAAFSYSSSQYFSLMRTILFKYCKISDNEDELEIRKKILDAVLDLTGEENDPNATEFGEYAALMGQIAGVAIPNSFIDQLEPQKRNNLLIEAMSDFLLSKASSNPLVLVLDDLHWIDDNSLSVVDRIVAKVTRQSVIDGGQSNPILLLLLHRPDFSHVWPVSSQNNNSYVAIRLERLTPQQMEPLVRQFLEEWLKAHEPDRKRQLSYAPVPTQIMSVVERSGGNAFFAEEILKRLLEDAYLVADEEEPSGWRVEGDFENFRAPETLQEILLARVDRLDMYDKRVLQIASVIGHRFEQRILFAVNELKANSGAVERSIGNLQRKDLIVVERTEPESEYVFRHYLTREVAYNNLLGVERSNYHGQIADAIELYKHDRLHDHTIVDDLAYHYEHSNNEEKAAEYLILAGHMRKGLFRNDEALKAFYQAQEILLGPDFEDDSNTVTRLVQIDSNIGDILILKEQYDEAISHYADALQHCDDPTSRIALLAKQIEVLGKVGSHDRAIEAYEQARLEFDRISTDLLKNDSKMQHLHAKLLYQIGWIYYSQGRTADALNAYEVSLSLLDEADPTNRELQDDRGRAYNGLGSIYTDKGELVKAEQFLRKALVLNQQANDPASLGRTYNVLGMIAVFKGDLVKAEQYWKLTYDNAQRAGDIMLAGASLGGLGIIAERQGRLDTALRYFRSLEKSPTPYNTISALINIGQVLIHQEQFEEAKIELDKAITLAVSIGLSAQVTEGYSKMGWLYIATRNWPEAERWLGEGLARALELNAPELIIQTRLLRFELYLEQDLVDRAVVEQEAVAQLVAGISDPLLIGQFERLNGRLAFLQGDFNTAVASFEKSIEELEAIKAFLETSYTKVYYAHTLIGFYQHAGDPGILEYTRTLLMQSIITFEVCEAPLRKGDAELLLSQISEPELGL